MNFFGHAVAACWRSDEPKFVLGSMLPDFANMCRGRITGSADSEIAAGIDWHHVIDRVFHKLPAFLELQRELVNRLRKRGLSRGSALGAGHVGVELLLDGALLDDEVAARAYPLALDAGAPDKLGGALMWREPNTQARWETLRLRLGELGVPHGYRDAQEVCRRVVQVLKSRPLLAIEDDDHIDILGDELVVLREQILLNAAPLMAELRTRAQALDTMR